MVHIVGHYELGRTLGEGTFAKVKLAKDTNTQTLYAMKVFSRSEMTGELLAKIKDEVSILKHVRHPNGEPARGAVRPRPTLNAPPTPVANLHEVLASKTHVYVVLELVTGGELFDRIATSGETGGGTACRDDAHSPSLLRSQASWRSATRAPTSSSS